MTDFAWSAVAWLHWLTLDTSYLSVETRYWWGFLVSLGCFLMVTLWFVKDVSGRGGDPRLFTILALFAGVWALTASIYEAPPYGEGKAPSSGAFRPHDVAADLASFLMVFVGALLAREGTEPKRYLNSYRLQVLALGFLGALVVPTQLAPRLGLSPSNTELTELIVACGLGVLGFIAIATGSKAIAKPEHYNWMFWIVVVYALLLIGRHVQLIALLPGRKAMSDFMVLSFALLKVLLTFVFCYIIVDYHDRQSSKNVDAVSALAA